MKLRPQDRPTYADAWKKIRVIFYNNRKSSITFMKSIDLNRPVIKLQLKLDYIFENLHGIDGFIEI